VPHSEKWWNIQRLYVWKFIEDGNYKAAYSLAENHAQVEGKSLTDAEWLCGWLSYAYLRNPARAYTHFYKLYHAAQFPVSKSRGAYWAGKAATAHGSAEIGLRWLKLAAEYPATFYGQLALAEIHGKAGASLPPPIRATPTETKAFAARPVAQAALILDAMDEDALANKFLMHLVQNAKSHTERAMAAEMMEDIGKHYLTVKVAKEAMKFNTILPDIGYPMIKFTPVREIEPALPLAIARQESEFNPRAESTAGALGLMQLLPSTAKEVARKIGQPFNKSALTANPSYNMQLGSTYLADLINAYRGSYILAIAAYNAGPGRVSRWREEFGDPRNPDVDPILWIERIPITETRNYVQRVIENLQMYRHRINGYKAAPMMILQDLRR
jgi:soluble lytic murein transglycosylase